MFIYHVPFIVLLYFYRYVVFIVVFYFYYYYYYFPFFCMFFCVFISGPKRKPKSQPSGPSCRPSSSKPAARRTAGPGLLLFPTIQPLSAWPVRELTPLLALLPSAGPSNSDTLAFVQARAPSPATFFPFLFAWGRAPSCWFPSFPRPRGAPFPPVSPLARRRGLYCCAGLAFPRQHWTHALGPFLLQAGPRPHLPSLTSQHACPRVFRLPKYQLTQFTLHAIKKEQDKRRVFSSKKGSAV